MAPNTASLLAEISFWEFWGYVALAAVAIGVIGESIKEFTDLPGSMGIERPLTRISALILIAGLAGEGITQPNTNAANAKLVALANKETAQLTLALQTERTKTSARLWTKEQFDAIQELKGIVPDVGIIVQDKCPECRSYANSIELALNEAGIRMHGEDVYFGDDWGGVLIYVPLSPDERNAPDAGEKLAANTVVGAFRKGGIPATASSFINCADCRKDIPIIVIGAVQKELLAMPYSPIGNRSWSLLPLKR